MKIVIETVPQSEQRYDTVGDYFPSSDGWTFHITEGALDDVMLVALHELTEWWWAQKHHVPNDAIDAFDLAYEAKRHPDDESEPGDDPACPVYEGHQIATAIERTLAAFFKIDWTRYEARLNDRLPVRRRGYQVAARKARRGKE